MTCLVLDAYLECAAWADCQGDGHISCDASFSDDFLAVAKKDVNDFLEALEASSINHDDWSYEQIGHDFWLTRNGHGAGFWDRDLPFGDDLSQLAEAFGPCELYEGDDGLIYSL